MYDPFEDFLEKALHVVIPFAIGFCAILAGYAIGTPRLVGTDCVGAEGPLYANEESDFPPCALIEPYQGFGQ